MRDELTLSDVLFVYVLGIIVLVGLFDEGPALDVAEGWCRTQAARDNRTIVNSAPDTAVLNCFANDGHYYSAVMQPATIFGHKAIK